LTLTDLPDVLTFSFWLNADFSVLFRMHDIVHIVSLKTKKISLSISLMRPFLALQFASPQTVASLRLFPLCRTNRWSHCLVQVRRSLGKVTTIQDSVRALNFDFMPIQFKPGPLKVIFGGCADRPVGKVVGLVSDILIYAGEVTAEEQLDNMPLFASSKQCPSQIDYRMRADRRDDPQTREVVRALPG
jgi:hypothetical protein